MNGSNLLDNLNIPVEDTPDVDITKNPESKNVFDKAEDTTPLKVDIVESKEDIKKEVSTDTASTKAGPFSAFRPPVSPAQKKEDFFKQREEKVSKEIFSTKNLPFGLDTYTVKRYVLNFIVPIICGIVILLLLVFVVFPAFSSVPALNSELAAKRELKNRLIEKNQKLENIADLKQVFDEYSSLVDKVLSSDKKVPELLTEVDHIAKTSGLSVEKLSYALSEGATGEMGFPMVDVSLSVTGDLDQYINFLQTIENASRYVEVSNYRYSVTQDTQQLNVVLLLQSPYLSVSSSAVTDEPIKLDINSTDFSKFVTKIKSLEYYDPANLRPVEAVETQPEEVTTEEAAAPLTQ